MASPTKIESITDEEQLTEQVTELAINEQSMNSFGSEETTVFLEMTKTMLANFHSILDLLGENSDQEKKELLKEANKKSIVDLFIDENCLSDVFPTGLNLVRTILKAEARRKGWPTLENSQEDVDP